MSRQLDISAKLEAGLHPLHLSVVNESHMHSVPANSETHFKLVVVSDAFNGQRLVQRHQAVNKLLHDEFTAGLHALSMETLTAEEWAARGGETLASPQCMGGSKAG